MSQPLRILHLEDNPHDAELVKGLLVANGFTCDVLVIESREEFASALHRERFDLIISDFSLPSYDGRSALLLARNKYPDVPYIFFSGTIGEDAAVEALKDGATDYVLKQRPARLVAAVRRALSEAEERTERKRAEEKLRQSEEQFRLIMENMTDLVAVLDLEGKRLYNSPSYKGIFDNLESLHGTDSFADIHPEDRDRIHRIFRETVATGAGQRAEFRFLLKDGSIRHIESQGNVIRDENRTPARVVVVSRDITERKRAEEELRKTEAQLHQAQKLEGIGQLAGGIAHDFNNLLTVINGYSDMTLQTLPPNHPVRAQVEQIREAGRRAASLTQQILAFSRKQTLNSIVFNLNEAVANMEKLLRRLIGAHITLVTSPDSVLGRMKADQGQIEQVIMNLAVNARDAMPNGGTLTIETRNVELDESFTRAHVSIQPGPYIKLAVRDTGCGMDAATQNRIFEPFFTTKGPDKGTGLGLATVYGIVKQSGGTIGVESEVGIGSTFSVYLPRVQDETEPDAQTRVSLDLPGGSETVLLVEDEDMVRSLARQVLRGQGYTVLDARHGTKAQEVGEKYAKPIHLLLTDLIMPGMNGRELADRLSSLHPEMKVLYISGYENNVLSQQGQTPTGTAFIAKPFTPDALVRKVREVLDTQRRS